MKSNSREPASFRDPAGFLFRHNGVLIRQINQAGQKDYDELISSGLFAHLVDKQLIVPHMELDSPIHNPSTAYKILQLEPVPFISYPFEWAFSQHRSAALLTLQLQRMALDHNMSLKDASAYNIQFVDWRPILIDTLSFKHYVEGQPWIAYQQFCQHFLAPLALMSHADIGLGQLLQIYLDGIPLDLVSDLLPWKTRANVGLLFHQHLHVASQRCHAGRDVMNLKRAGFSRSAFLGFLDSLSSTIHSLTWKPAGTAWGDCYRHHADH